MIQYRLKYDLFRLPTLRIQAHCLVAQANTQPKPAKELACLNAQTEENNARNANKEGSYVITALMNN